MLFKKIIPLLVLVLALSCQPGGPSTVEYLSSETTKSMSVPFSDAVRVGNILFVSGQLGIIPGKMELVPGGMAAEAKQAIENMRAILEANGSSLNRVVKVTVFLADIEEWGEFNSVYTSYFSENLPARSAMGVNGLALGGRLEIECIAVVE